MKKIILFLCGFLFLFSCSNPIDEIEPNPPEVEQDKSEETEDESNDKVYDDIEWGPLS